MANFNEELYLADMYQDGYYPDFLVDKVRALIVPVVASLEAGERGAKELQARFDAMTIGINDLEDEFLENDSEIETVARESIGQTVRELIDHFGLDMDVETAIRERDW